MCELIDTKFEKFKIEICRRKSCAIGLKLYQRAG